MNDTPLSTADFLASGRSDASVVLRTPESWRSEARKVHGAPSRFVLTEPSKKEGAS